MATKRFTIITGRLQPSTSFNHSVKFRVSSSAPNSIQGSILALNITMEASAAEEVGTDDFLALFVFVRSRYAISIRGNRTWYIC